MRQIVVTKKQAAGKFFHGCYIIIIKEENGVKLYMKKYDKSVRNISIIGWADGPTSIFIAGRTGKRPFKVRVKNWIYRQRRKSIARRIRPNPHSLKQVTAFIKKEYSAAEMSMDSWQYRDNRASLREGLMMFRQIEQRSEAVSRIPEEQFPMDFHIYEIYIEGGRMEIEIDYRWDVLGISYSGNRKAMRKLKAMGRRIQLYYGVTKEDIQEESKRYSSLLTALASD